MLIKQKNFFSFLSSQQLRQQLPDQVLGARRALRALGVLGTLAVGQLRELAAALPSSVATAACWPQLRPAAWRLRPAGRSVRSGPMQLLPGALQVNTGGRAGLWLLWNAMWNVDISAAIAQLGERQTEDMKAPGSIPGLGIFRISCAPRENHGLFRSCL